MAKTCPHCGYRPIGPFTDNCPMCAEPVRNVRSDRGGGGGAGSSNLIKWIIIGSVVVVLGVAGCCGVAMWRFGNFVEDAEKQWAEAQAAVEADRKARTIVVSGADLIKEYQTDATAAEQKYLGKYLEITGVVERHGRGRFDTTFVILHAGDETAKVKIECFFDMANQIEEGRIKRLNKGQTITVRGEYDGQVSNIQLRECVLVQ